ncbi:MAG: GAF domain-containing protein, partial [Anaerolineae bacterium]|nr:GAF domain-containing protein [Anaerolineae bacterium]
MKRTEHMTYQAALYEVAALSTRGLRHDRLGAFVVEKASLVLGDAVVVLYLLDADGEQLVPWETAGIDLDGLAPVLRRQIPDAALTGDGGPFLSNPEASTSWISLLGFPAAIRTAILAPLRSQGQLYGLISAGFDADSPVGIMTLDELRIVLGILAGRAAEALDIDRDLQALREDQSVQGEQFEALSHLYEVSLGLARQQRELKPILVSVSAQLARLLKADGAGVWLWRPEKGCLELAYTLQGDDPSMTGRQLKPGEGLTGKAFSERRT